MRRPRLHGTWREEDVRRIAETSAALTKYCTKCCVKVTKPVEGTKSVKVTKSVEGAESVKVTKPIKGAESVKVTKPVERAESG